MKYFGIQCALSAPEAEALQYLCRGHRIVECGALLGASTAVIAQTAASVVSIDRHEGYGPATLRGFMSNFYRVPKATEKVVPVVADALALLPHLDADRYFIDMDGTYATTMGALVAIPRGRPVMVHDFGRARCQGVEQALKDAGYRMAGLVDTLAVAVRR